LYYGSKNEIIVRSTGAVFSLNNLRGTTQQGINLVLVNGNNDLVGIVEKQFDGIQIFCQHPVLLILMTYGIVIYLCFFDGG
jgi:hypothetical protein